MSNDKMSRLCTVFLGHAVIISMVTNAVSWTVEQKVMKQCRRQNETIYCDSIIPQDIPAGISSVFLNNMNTNNSTYLGEGLFYTENWENVNRLEITWISDEENGTISNYAFRGLTNLRELYLHAKWLTNLGNSAFAGLDKLTVLDFSGCFRLSIDSLIQAMNGTDILHNLQSLSLVELNRYRSGINLNKAFFDIISAKNITYLDLSSTEISMVDVGAWTETSTCNKLIYLNISHVKLNNYKGPYRTCASLRYIDVSYSSLPHRFVGAVMYIPNLTVRVNEHSSLFETYKLFENTKTLVANGLFNTLAFINIKLIVNATFNMDSFQNVYLRDNGFIRLDIEIVNLSPQPIPIQVLDLSSNKIEFINPDMMSPMSLLRYLDLSKNNLWKMSNEHITEFERLLSALVNLTNINLSSNNLSTLPAEIFIKNTNLEVVDLSRNHLHQIIFKLEQANKLKLLDLRYNEITIMGRVSIHNLQSIFNAHINRTKYLTWTSNGTAEFKQDYFRVDFSFNQLSCSNCETFDFLQLFLANSQYFVFTGEMCHNERDDTIPLDNTALSYVQDLCERHVRVRNTVIVSSVLLVASIVIIVIVVRVKRSIQLKINRNKNITLIRKDRHALKYVALLSSSEDDNTVVNNDIYEPLEEHLKQLTNKLKTISSAFTCIKSGESILNQTEQLLSESGVLLIAVTHNYIQEYGRHFEIDQAVFDKKPIVLFLTEGIDANTLLLKTFCKQYTINEHNKNTNGHFWKDVCQDILALMPVQRKLALMPVQRKEEETILLVEQL